MSKRALIAPKYILTTLVQIIYSLLQFHLRRLFKLDPSQSFVPDLSEFTEGRRGDNIQEWFVMMLGVIMPGAVVNGIVIMSR